MNVRLKELSRPASHTNDFVVTENTACRLLNPDINNMTVKGVELAGRFIHSGVSMREDEPDSVRVAAVARIRNIMNIPIGVKPFIALYSWDREILR